uniref:Uncharacterized protein n=1 Tax=Mola mola TaxID=94237 RepID=A0A3Q3WEF3_MOLML
KKLQELHLPTVTHVMGALMPWACSAASGTETLVQLHEIMENKDYVAILKDNFYISIKEICKPF